MFKPNEHVAGIIFQVDAKMAEVERAQQLAEIKNQAKRHAKRMAEFTAWVKPEAVAARIKAHEEAAAAALEKAKLMAGPQEEEIPIPNPLPKEMRGQPLSTIKKMLRHQREERMALVFSAERPKPATFHIKGNT